MATQQSILQGLDIILRPRRKTKEVNFQFISLGKFYAGIARACFNTDAIIVDNAVATGIEKFALRRDVKIIGVAPEAGI